MQSKLVLLFFSLLLFHSTAQHIPFYKIDTLKAGSKTFGTTDTADFQSLQLSSSFPILNAGQKWGLPSIFQLFNSSGYVHIPPNVNSNVTFSALPHIGIGYFFGNQSSQVLNANYQQTFRYGIFVNLNIKNLKSGGFYRNSGFSNTSYDLKVLKYGKRYSFAFQGVFQNEKRSWNGGVSDLTEVETYAPQLIAVNKADAASHFSFQNYRLENTFRVLGDSLTFLGLRTKHELRIQKRSYTEYGDLANLYNAIYVDSFQTNDSLKYFQLSNQAGLMLKNKNLTFEATAEMRNWKYTTGNLKSDTTEIYLNEQIFYQKDQLLIRHSGLWNVIGAKNGLQFTTDLLMPLFGIDFQVHHQFKALAPELSQRKFFSNNVSYQLSDFYLQQGQQLTVSAKRKVGNWPLKLNYSMIQVAKNYRFDTLNAIWSQQLTTSQLLAQHIQLATDFHTRLFHLYPRYTLTLMNKAYQFVPTHQVDVRFLMKGGIFKAKKLKGMVGLDVLAFSGYKPLTFNPQMGIFDWEKLPQTAKNKAFVNAGVFIGFEVDQFRFFARWDNMAYLFMDRKTQFILGSPMGSTQIKLGVTWDFWN